MAYSIASLDELGEGYGFRKIRKPLGVTAFGVNALVFPPGFDGPAHYHDQQDELYFVHRGTATFLIGEEDHEVGEGGLVHIQSTTPRSVSNRSSDDLVLFVVGGKDDVLAGKGRTDVYTTKLLAGGSLDAWRSVAPLPEGRTSMAVAHHGDFVYVTGGGFDAGGLDSVYAARVRFPLAPSP